MATVFLVIQAATLAYGQAPMGFGIERTNAELMEASRMPTAAPAGAKAVDAPLERFGTSLQESLRFDSAPAPAGAGGLRVDFAFGPEAIADR